MKVTYMDNNGSVCLEHKGMNVWIDVWEEDNDIRVEWNKYIFFLDNPIDLEIKAFQENIDNASEAFGLATEYYIHTNNKEY
jgi:hypothetical protein